MARPTTIVLATAMLLVPLPAQRYVAIDLGVPAGTSANALVVPADINEYGDVVGVVQGPGHAPFLHVDGAGLVPVSLPPGETGLALTGINDLGQLAAYDPLGGPAWRWTWGSGWRQLGAATTGLVRTTRINNRGHVVGQTSNYDAFYWSPRLGLFAIPAITSIAWSINESDQVVLPNHLRLPTEAARWHPTQPLVPMLPNPNPYVRARAVNNHGDCAGESHQRLSNRTDFHLWLWTEAGGPQDLGFVTNQTLQAWDLNDDRVIVGEAETGGGTFPFVHTPQGGFQRLAAITSVPSGLRMQSAYAINNAGQIAVLARDSVGGGRILRLDPVRPQAAVAPAGTGCGGTNPPDLAATKPVIGGATTLQVHGAATAPGGLLLAFGRITATAFGSCTVYLDPTNAVAIPLTTDASGDWSLALALPNDPNLATVPLAAQAALVSGVPAQLELTNGLILRPGH